MTLVILASLLSRLLRLLHQIDGDNIGSAESINLTWDTNFTSDTFNIEYSTDFGSTWQIIVEEQDFP